MECLRQKQMAHHTAPRKFHLGWFTNFGVDAWNGPFGAGGSPWTGEFHVEFAKALERACFDYIMLEDTLMLSEAYGCTAEFDLAAAVTTPKLDPAPLAALIGAATSRLGIVTTLSTLAYPPFLLARLCATLDHISRGRFGWNIVTTTEDSAAKNFGLNELPPRDIRYDMADEYVDLVCKLLDSWDPDAIVLDRTTDTYADYTKVRPVNFSGQYFRSRGPLNTARSPQGRPALIQAGASPRGRDFAAKFADSIIATANGAAGMKAFRDDIRLRAAKFGRDPDGIKVLFLLAPVLGETDEEAKAKNERGVSSTRFVQRALALYSAFSDIDLSQFDLDKPLPRLTTNGGSGSLDKFAQWGSGKTLRQLAAEGGKGSCLDLVGTPDQVAASMGAAMDEVGGDGFLLQAPFRPISRRYIVEVTEGLVPALQRRGLVRNHYTTATLRETLREF
jgi:FMN-dependent oxidoreductase (nitrilotriacetate monooxygenase family)